MFVGHAAVAFALCVRLAVARGLHRRDALRVGVVAAVFATLPDVDVAYAPVGLLGAKLDAMALASAFWSTSTLVHRGVTHSLLVSAAVAVVAVGWFVAARADRRGVLLRAGLAGVSVPLVVATAVDAGSLAGLVLALYVGSAALAAELVARRGWLSGRSFAFAATVGVLTHPFGDVFTGEPPAFLYPLDAVLLTERVTLAADPTLHLLGAFAVELAAIWVAVAVFLGLWDVHLRTSLTARASVAAGYAAVVFFIPPPTLDLSYPFVFSVLSVGALGLLPRVRLVGGPEVEIPDRWTAAVTGLAAVSVAWAAYGAAYVLL